MTLEACGYPDGCAGVGRVRGGHGHVGTFNGRLRDELFAREAFDGVLEARILFDDWADVYNRHRPHGSLGYLGTRRLRRGVEAQQVWLSEKQPIMARVTMCGPSRRGCPGRRARRK
jgi:hypothetical protein